jgi:Rab5 GDP/GTP exchange factor
VQSIPDLENKGATVLFNSDDLNKKIQEYPFLYARAGDLTVADVENLLNSYKKIVLRYDALAQGMGFNPETTHVQSEQTASELVVSGVPQKHVDSVVNNNENSEGITQVADDITSGNLHSEAVSTAGTEQVSQQTEVYLGEDVKTQKDESSDQP